MVIARDGQVVVTEVDKKLRELRTLKQHYYPEVTLNPLYIFHKLNYCLNPLQTAKPFLQGGFGWLVLLVGSMVHVLVNGSQVGP